MFTGLVEAVGVVARLARRPDALEFAVVPDRFAAAELALGDSLAIDGVCLTVTTVADGAAVVLAGAETLARTSLGELAVGARVNLERALVAGARLGGHLVQGHVDGVGRLRGRRDEGANLVLEVAAGPEVLRYVVEKGSISVDGISLTVNRVGDTSLSVALIPHTVASTSLGGKPVGAPLNLEVDLIAKYVEKLVAPYRPSP